MFRGPQILTWSCLLVRDSHLSTGSEHACAVWQGARYVRRRRRNEWTPGGGIKEESSLSRAPVPLTKRRSSLSSNCDYYRIKQSVLSSHHQSPQITAPGKAKQLLNPWKYDVVGGLGVNTKAVSSYCDRFTYLSCLQSWRRPQCSLLQSHLYHKQHSVRPFSLSSCMSLTFNNFRQQTFSFFPPQIRTIHQAAPRFIPTWRDCLSSENEHRCRQRLVPNLKLYDDEKGRKRVSQNQGKTQARCASILVSLCSVDEEPAFLFTLRSCKLRGRHKGDVWSVAD